MATYRDINSSVRIGGSLTLPAGSITLSNTITLDNATGQITATKFSGDGSLLTNLSSAAMTDVAKLDGTRAFTGHISLSSNRIYLRTANDGNHTIGWYQNELSGTTLDGPRLQGYTGIELSVTNGSATPTSVAVFRSNGITLKSALTVAANLSASGYTITGTTINATSNLQENGTNLSAKYLALTGGTMTSQLKIAQSVNTPALLLEGASAGWASGIQFNNTTATTGRKYGLYSANNGGFSISDETAAAIRFIMDSSGNFDFKAGSLTTTNLAKASSFYVGATLVIETDAKIDWNKIKNAPTTYAPSAHTHASSDIVSVATQTLIGRNSAGSGAAEQLNASTVRTILNVSDGATKTESSSTNGNIKINGTDITVYTHPSTDGNLHVPATSTTNSNKVLKAGSTAGSLSWGSVAWSEISSVPSTFTPSSHTHAYTDVISVPTSSILGRVSASTGATEALTATQVRTLINVADGANNYSHPSGDGSLHVPATSTTNNNKVLKAGATAGSLSWGAVDWGEVTNKPTYDNYAKWILKVNTDAGSDVTSGTAVDFKAGSNVTLTRSGNTITIASTYTDTNTWRPIDTTPVSTNTTNSISSSWAYTHAASTGNSGHVPATGSAGQFLAYDGTWQTPPDTNTDTNNYLTGVTGSGNGTVTFTRSGLANLTWDASHNHDSSYAAINHTHSTYVLKAGDTMTGSLRINADNTFLGLDTGSSRMGFLKKTGYGPAIAIGKAKSFDIYETSTDFIDTDIVNATVTSIISASASSFTYKGNTVYHSGNLSTSSFVTTGTSQSTGSGFTVKGTAYIGNAGNAGNLTVSDSSNTKLIHLDGASSGNPLGGTSTNVYIQGSGNATFKGTVDINKLTVTDGTVIANLNASKLNGKVDTDFADNNVALDQGGYGVYNGFVTTATTPPSSNVSVSAGVAYLDNGRRVSISNLQVSFNSASTTYDRIDVVYIKPSSSYSSGAPITVVAGTPSASPVAPSVPAGAIPLARILIKQNAQGGVTVTDGTGGTANQVTDVRMWRDLRYYSGTGMESAGTLKTGGDIYEKYVSLESKYARLGTANTFTGNQTINGRLMVSSTGNDFTNYYVHVSDGTYGMSMTPRGLFPNNDFGVYAGTDITLQPGSGKVIGLNGKVRAVNNAVTITIPKGQTSVTWTHNYGGTNYALNLTSNSFERHVRWNNKQNNTIDIQIDTPSDQDILVDCILIGY